MQQVSAEILKGLLDFDAPTIFNAVVAVLNKQNEDYQCYTGPEVRYLLPDLGRIIGYAVTSEVTPLDPHAPAIPWNDYYDALYAMPGPKIACMKDVDKQVGRGASFGDGMATLHKAFGCTGAIVDGSVRDIDGIRRVGLPMFGGGLVPGHGPFQLVRQGQPIMVGRMWVRQGDLLFGDTDGIVRIPNDKAAEVLERAGQIRKAEADIFAFYHTPGLTMDMVKEWQQKRK
ncbi:MAG: RraA family protein [Chloroflexi bacterium]|nr:RraA family protein [Chloroflexota bacterium]